MGFGVQLSKFRNALGLAVQGPHASLPTESQYGAAHKWVAECGLSGCRI